MCHPGGHILELVRLAHDCIRMRMQVSRDTEIVILRWVSVNKTNLLNRARDGGGKEQEASGRMVIDEELQQ